MPPLDSIAAILDELIAERSVPRSLLGARARAALRPLYDSGAVREVRSGAGWRLRVENPDAVKQLAEMLYPLGLSGDPGALDRADAVARLRHAKRGANRCGEPVLIRAFSDAPLGSDQGPVDVQETTRLCGTACFVLSDAHDWSYAGQRVAVVENLEPFLRFEQRFDGFDAALYSAGRLSDRLLRWIAGQAFAVVHFGDYDPVGLQEYRRLKLHCSDRATLFVPQNLRDLVRRHGQPELLRDSSAVFSGLRSGLDEQAAGVLQCLDDFGLGLEQEILWAALEKNDENECG